MQSFIKSLKVYSLLVLSTLLVTSCTSPSQTPSVLQENTTDKVISASSMPLPSSLPSDTPIPSPSASPFEQDAKTMIQYVEETHPAFLLEAIPSTYYSERESYLTAVQSVASPMDFKFLTQKYLSSLHDLHTYVTFGPQLHLDLSCIISENEELILWNDTLHTPTEKKITQIGGKNTSSIFQSIDTYFTFENETGRLLNYTDYLTKDFLQYIGCTIENDSTKVTFEMNGDLSEEIIPFVSSPTNMEPFIDSKWIDDIYYLDINTFVFEEEEAQNQFKEQLSLLNDAVAHDLNKIIIDIRHNYGGDLSRCLSLFTALRMNPPTTGVFFRYSPMAAPILGKDTGSTMRECNLSTSLKNENIKLVVLISEDSYSISTLFATYVQDGKLGTVIGRPSANSPSFYSNTIRFELPNSQISGSLSTCKTLRPDSNANQTILQPDIVTEIDEDALDYAISYLNEK